jgi:hypothetical protein
MESGELMHFLDFVKLGGALREIPLETASGTPLLPGERITHMGGDIAGKTFTEITCLPGFEIEYLGRATVQRMPEGGPVELAIFQDRFSSTKNYVWALIVGGEETNHALFHYPAEETIPNIVTTLTINKAPAIVKA